MQSLKFIDVFSGVGGISVGLMQVRLRGQCMFEPLLLADASASAISTFRRNYPHVPSSLGRVENLTREHLSKTGVLSEGQTLDMLVGGPPCQGFSILRKNKHLEDERNLCLREFFRLVADLRPKVVLMENVKNLLHCNGGGFADEIRSVLTDLQYKFDLRVLSAERFGVPQIRERAFLLAFRSDLGIETVNLPTSAPTGEEKCFVSVEEALGDLPMLQPGETAYAYTCDPKSEYQRERRKGATVLHNHEARTHSESFVEKISRIAPGSTNRDLGANRFDAGRDKEYFSQAYARLHGEELAYTITTHFHNPGSGRFTHYRDVRAITVREAARLQGFDDTFIFYGSLGEQQEQVGNAVPPILARHLGDHIVSQLDSGQKKKVTFRRITPRPKHSIAS